MRTALLDPSQGYYASANAEDNGRDVLGARGDFITSPEISQVFGELLAVYFVARWQAVGSPDQMRLVEFGPGKGTLLADMIRVSQRLGGGCESHRLTYPPFLYRHSLASPSSIHSRPFIWWKHQKD